MILLDTHALLWWVAGGKMLSAQATRQIARSNAVLVSPVSIWEIATLVRKGRIKLDRDLYEWSRDLMDVGTVALAALSPQAATGAALLGSDFPADPADRLLYSTARELNVPFLSKDVAIQDYARTSRDVKVIW